MLGTKQQTEIPKFLSDSDVLILPSLYDGWGTVVNEALQSGCFVIVSDACGAKMLVDNDSRLGLVFHHGNKQELAKCLSYLTDNLNNIREGKQYRIQWAKDHISGQVMAKYMLDCLESVSNKK